MLHLRVLQPKGVGVASHRLRERGAWSKPAHIKAFDVGFVYELHAIRQSIGGFSDLVRSLAGRPVGCATAGSQNHAVHLLRLRSTVITPRDGKMHERACHGQGKTASSFGQISENSGQTRLFFMLA
jgi:hypothetical protein